MTILGLAESFNTMKRPDSSRPDSAQPDRIVPTAYFMEIIKVRYVKFCHNLHPCFQFVLLKFGFDIFHIFETMGFSAT